MQRRHIAILPILIALVVMGFKYCSAEKVTSPISGKTARVGLSSQQEETLGLQSYREVLSQSDVVTSGPEYDVVNGWRKDSRVSLVRPQKTFNGR